MTPAERKIKSYRENPKRFVHEEFHVELELWQEDALASLASGMFIPQRRLAMKAATGVGKSSVLAWIGWWRLCCFGIQGEHPKGAALSGEGRDNLRDNLWSEMSKWQERSALLKAAFTWNKEQIYANDHRETWFLSARSYPKDANSEQVGQSLSGLHSKFPFILLDETGGMPPIVGQRAEQIFTGGTVDGLIAQAGNPTTTTGLLYATTRDSRGVTVITITADPDDPKRSSRVDINHARQMIEKYGRSNPWVQSTILGIFPDGAMNTLFSMDDVERAMDRHILETDYALSQKRIGIDVARFGSDSTVIAPRQGLRAFNMVEMRNADGPTIASRAILAKSKWGSEVEYIDDTGGFGASVIDSMIQGGYSPVAVNFSSSADDRRYLNRRAEMWFRMANWTKRGAVLPKDPQLLKELITPTYYFQNGKFQLEPKEQIKKRLGFSPDRADALCLTFAHAEAPATAMIPANLQGSFAKFESDWDPHSDL